MKSWKPLMLLPLLLFMHPALAVDWHEALSGSRLVIGITSKETQLEVRDPNNAFNDYGTLTSSMYETPLLSFYTPDIYFGNSNWGSYVEFGWRSFRLHQQTSPSLGSDPVDLGTSASGSFLHATPVLFYNWGDRSISKAGGQSFKFGIGLGVGYLGASGNVKFTETTQEIHSFDVGGLGTAINVLMEYRYKQWYARAVGGGPYIQKGSYEYNIFDFSMDFGYIFSL